MSREDKQELIITIVLIMGLLGGTLRLTWVLLDPVRYLHEDVHKNSP